MNPKFLASTGVLIGFLLVGAFWQLLNVDVMLAIPCGMLGVVIIIWSYIILHQIKPWLPELLYAMLKGATSICQLDPRVDRLCIYRRHWFPLWKDKVYQVTDYAPTGVPTFEHRKTKDSVGMVGTLFPKETSARSAVTTPKIKWKFFRNPATLRTYYQEKLNYDAARIDELEDRVTFAMVATIATANSKKRLTQWVRASEKPPCSQPDFAL